MFFIGYTSHTKKGDTENFEYTAGVTSEVVTEKAGFYKLNLQDRFGNILKAYELNEKDFFTLTMRKDDGQ